MALKKNVFDDATIEFLDALADLEFIARASDLQLRQLVRKGRLSLEEYRQEIIKEGNLQNNIMGISSRLLIPNLFGTKYGRVAFGHESKHDDELFKLLDEINFRSQAQSLCVTYETFERFLKRFGCLLFFQNRNTWKLVQIRKFHQNQTEMAKAESKGTKKYFHEYVAFVAKNNCEDLLREIGKALPSFDTLAKNNWHGDFYSDFRILSCIRHTTVHCNGEVGEHTRQKLQHMEREFVESITIKSVVTSRDTILPPVGAAERLLNGISALVYSLYRIASNEFNMALSDFK
jgi:hypothetical protein